MSKIITSFGKKNTGADSTLIRITPILALIVLIMTAPVFIFAENTTVTNICEIDNNACSSCDSYITMFDPDLNLIANLSNMTKTTNNIFSYTFDATKTGEYAYTTYCVNGTNYASGRNVLKINMHSTDVLSVLTLAVVVLATFILLALGIYFKNVWLIDTSAIFSLITGIMFLDILYYISIMFLFLFMFIIFMDIRTRS